jgi:exodeoxyribonuclease V beta subunit
MDGERIRADIEDFVASAQDDVGWRRPATERAVPEHDDDNDLVLEPRPHGRVFDHTPHIASFTSLTGSEEKAWGPSVGDVPSPLFEDLPGGARTGLLLHAILENADLGALDGSDAEVLIRRQLALHGFDVEHSASVQRDLVEVVSTPMGSDPALPRLRELGADRQLRELEFTLAVERPNLHELCDILRRHGAPAAAPGYHERLANLDGQTLRGFLRGFIDLMFEWDGRWYVADYKSNRLPAYRQSDVIEAVQREHYVLQGHLYSAAAHRYLRQRDPEYDPEKNWGGALFLFLRGMADRKQAGASVFVDRQSPSLLCAMDRWLGGLDGAC